jgi:hypothetical protein
VGGAENQKRYDNPKRTTLTNLPKAQVPERNPTLSGLPAPPALPLEHAPTKPAPRNPLEKKTWRLPAPPSALAQARRTDPPPGILVPADEVRPTIPPGATLPPASLTPDAGSLEAVRRRAEKAETELAEMKRQARVRAEAASPATYPPSVSPPAVQNPVIVQQGVSTETLEEYRKAQTKLMLAVAALLVAIGGPCALWLTNVAMRSESTTKRNEVQITEVAKATETTKEKTIDGSKDNAITKADLAKFKLYFIAVQRRQGVAIRLPDGVREEDLPKLDFEAPLRKPGVVKPGPGLIVQTPP